MSFKRIFSGRGSYDVTTSLSDLQQRCNDLTSVITATEDLPTGYDTTNEAQPERTTPTTTSSSSSVSQTSSPSAMMQGTPNMHVDAIVEIGPTANIGFHAFEMDNKKQKTDVDALSNASKNNKCENCITNCLYFSSECCDCSIV